MMEKLFLGLMLVLFLILLACEPPDSRVEALLPPNIIWLVAEDIRPALGCYRDELAVTPPIDAMAQSGVRYTKPMLQPPSTPQHRLVGFPVCWRTLRPVQLLAMETLCLLSPTSMAVEVLGKWVQDDRPWLALSAMERT